MVPQEPPNSVELKLCLWGKAALRLSAGPSDGSVSISEANFEVEAAVANIKSAIKRNRQNEKRNARNRAIRAEVRTRTRSVLEAAEAGADDTDEKLKAAITKIDKSVSKGTMHKNTAARTKSRLIKRVRALQDA